MAKVQISRLADTMVRAGLIKNKAAFVTLCRKDPQAANALLVGAIDARQPRAAAALRAATPSGPAYGPVMAAGNWKPEGVRVARAGDPWSVKISGEAAHPQSVAAASIAAQRQAEAVNAATAQRSRSGFYDRSAGIAASGDNARRLAAARAADEARIRREQAARGI